MPEHHVEELRVEQKVTLREIKQDLILRHSAVSQSAGFAKNAKTIGFRIKEITLSTAQEVTQSFRVCKVLIYYLCSLINRFLCSHLTR
jgi:hypothetical protein